MKKIEFYKMSFDMDRIDETNKNGEQTIYAETTNMDEYEDEEVKKGFFENTIFSKKEIKRWPEICFYYSSHISDNESEYLLNVKRWPIVHSKVMTAFKKAEINGIRWYPIKLIDIETQKENNDYFVMQIMNVIDAFDMEKSKFKYNAKYDFYTFIPEETYLNVDVCRKYDIFRCDKSLAALYVSDKIKSMVQSNNWRGFYFYPQQ
ncbi:MAG: hypothetical protein E7304_03700 [Butyrivibrio sp.]|uniref:imm11 family protein n=1 Tax=Butyrivibrio sp. TaxID=28121 RepID=UPI001ED4861C|nr:DUF1629 domain-containing protein [Butyrivibrio sp.]MBE5840493.1 hypothetical protein [Butyrivibrio sp.]